MEKYKNNEGSYKILRKVFSRDFASKSVFNVQFLLFRNRVTIPFVN
jgi:hypothetical protein